MGFLTFVYWPSLIKITQLREKMSISLRNRKTLLKALAMEPSLFCTPFGQLLLVLLKDQSSKLDDLKALKDSVKVCGRRLAV